MRDISTSPLTPFEFERINIIASRSRLIAALLFLCVPLQLVIFPIAFQHLMDYMSIRFCALSALLGVGAFLFMRLHIIASALYNIADLDESIGKFACDSEPLTGVLLVALSESGVSREPARKIRSIGRKISVYEVFEIVKRYSNSNASASITKIPAKSSDKIDVCIEPGTR